MRDRRAGLFQGRHPRSRGRRRRDAVNPRGARHQGGGPLRLPGAGRRSRRRCARGCRGSGHDARFDDFDAVVDAGAPSRSVLRRPAGRESPSRTQRLVQRQALAGMIWSKQFYYYDIDQLAHRRSRTAAAARTRHRGRNADWRHLNNADVISMPDKWEYPWYAAWDLAFHCLPLALVDAELRQAAAAADDARMVHASERTAAGLRMGVRRRQPAGARLGELARVSDRSQAARR